MSRRALRGWLLGVLALATSACATLTPYQPLAGGYGYSEQKLEAGRYRVAFAGSEATPKQTVENYLLYRAAELTLLNGGDYFVMNHSALEAIGSNGPSVGIGLGGFRFGGSGGLGIGIGTSTSNDRAAYRADAEIQIRSGTKPQNAGDAYDARELKTHLEPLIRRTAQ